MAKKLVLFVFVLALAVMVGACNKINPVQPSPNTCNDSTASNFGGPLPCVSLPKIDEAKIVNVSVPSYSTLKCDDYVIIRVAYHLTQSYPSPESVSGWASTTFSNVPLNEEADLFPPL